MEEDCSVWFGAILRAEVAPIKIGKGSNVQDNCVLHTDLGFPVKIGENVTVGHSAVIHGSTVGSNCLIGMRSTLLNGSKIGDNCLVAAGSLITQNTQIPGGCLIVGSPAKSARKLSDEEITMIGLNAKHYRDFCAEYLKIQNEK
jgi:carbonic anhydrase/acetyltransferase-like protein (isoleucine patch superfamily)